MCRVIWLIGSAESGFRLRGLLGSLDRPALRAATKQGALQLQQKKVICRSVSNYKRIMTNNHSRSNILKFWRDVEIFNIAKAPDKDDHNRKKRNKCCLRYSEDNIDKALPWETGGECEAGTLQDKELAWRHIVYLGVKEKADLTSAMLSIFKERFSEFDLTGDVESLSETTSSKEYGCLAAFSVSQDGFLNDDFTSAFFSHGIECILNNESVNQTIDRVNKAADQFYERQKARESAVNLIADDAQEKVPVTWSLLQEEIFNLPNGIRPYCSGEFYVVIASGAIKRKTAAATIERGDHELPINSFYAKGLDKLSELGQLGAPLTQYLNESIPSRIDVLKNHEAMKSCLAAHKLSLARWPSESRHHLMLAQQAVVSHIDSHFKNNNGLVAVNGPPGTGKTTLLCDVIANVVVQRAIKIARLNSPRDAFLGRKTVELNNREWGFFPIDPAIVGGTGIVVSSNNNSAVENISKELPLKSKISKDFQEQDELASYFRSVANSVFNEFKKENETCPEAWGLISVALGNKANRTKADKALFGKPSNKEILDISSNDLSSLKTTIESVRQLVAKESPNADTEKQLLVRKWENEKVFFLETLAKIQQRIDQFIEIEKITDRSHELAQQIKNAENALCTEHQIHPKNVKAIEFSKATLERRALELQVPIGQAKERCQFLSIEVEELDELFNLTSIDNAYSLFEKLLNWLGIKTELSKQKSKNIGEAKLKKLDKAKQHSKQKQDLQGFEQQFSQILHELEEQDNHYQKELNRHEVTVAAQQNLHRQAEEALAKDRHVVEQFCRSNNVKVPDVAFFAQTKDALHLSSVWVSEEFEELRSQLFLSALRLHEATLRAESGRASSNFTVVSHLLQGTISSKASSQDIESIWDLLFFIVPVVSTTLASFDRLFSGLTTESLGWLLIDEAGQATPQSIASALWRSKKAVIIGDPLQIEPVMTVPFNIVAELRRQYQVDIKWSPSSESAQTLSDRTMGLGAYVGSTWTGLPLRSHRRCIDPMFKVSNAIAYDNQMVQAILNSSSLDLPPSAWHDVKGVSSNEKVVPEEMQALEGLLNKFKKSTYGAWPKDSNGEPVSLYVISPFKKVADACSDKIKNLGLSDKVKSGTVHTFQGKEAVLSLLY